jgi:hypothetical protein
MIPGMMCRKKIIFVPISALLCLALTSESSLALQSTPTLNVFVYCFPGLSSWVLEGAESEAMRILHPLGIELKWINCISQVLPPGCMSSHSSADLIVRFLPKALPQASTAALGIADSSDEFAAGFIFYDRVLALRTQTRPLAPMLGRVMTHEITHLLLPQEYHSEFGLMRGEWSAYDLRITSAACLGLSARSVQFMHREALRRVLAGRGREN